MVAIVRIAIEHGWVPVVPTSINGRVVRSAPERIIGIPSAVPPVPWIICGEAEGKCRVIIIKAIPIPRSKILVVVRISGVCLFVVITGCIVLRRRVLLLNLISCCSELRIAAGTPKKGAEENTGEKNLL
jgi:hypothetical protein